MSTGWKYFWLITTIISIAVIEFLIIHCIFSIQSYEVADDQGRQMMLMIFNGSAIITFLSHVLPQKDSDRLKNGAYGALASGIITLIISFVQKEQSINYLVFAFYGSAIGALNGWLVYASIAFVVWIRYGSLLPLVALITRGLESMSDEIISIDNSEPKNSFRYFLNRLNTELNIRLLTKDDVPLLDKATQSKFSPDALIELLTQRRNYLISIVQYVLTTLVELLNLLFRTSKFRASIIRFDKDETGQYKNGNHWIFYYGAAPPYLESDDFGSNSQAKKFIQNPNDRSPKQFDLKNDNDKIELRRTADRYDYFTLFRLNEQCVLTLDWAKGKTGRDTFTGTQKDIQTIIYNTIVDTLDSVTQRILFIERAIESQKIAEK